MIYTDEHKAKKAEMKEKALRKKVRSLIKEELSPSKKSRVLEDLENEVENIINSVLIDYGVHKDGLSDQQEAKFYRRLCTVADDTLDQYKTARKPSEIEGIEEYEEYMDLM